MGLEDTYSGLLLMGVEDTYSCLDFISSSEII
jgi:hypothetical protein